MVSKQTQHSETLMRLHAVVHGQVQGVNFRYYTIRTARRLGLTGWVANRWDGTVETVAEGPPDALDQFRSFLERGSPSAVVARVDATLGPATHEFSSFGLRYL